MQSHWYFAVRNIRLIFDNNESSPPKKIRSKDWRISRLANVEMQKYKTIKEREREDIYGVDETIECAYDSPEFRKDKVSPVLIENSNSINRAKRQISRLAIIYFVVYDRADSYLRLDVPPSRK